MRKSFLEPATRLRNLIGARALVYEDPHKRKVERIGSAMHLSYDHRA